MLKTRLMQARVIPVIVIEHVQDAIILGEILVQEGLPVAEITFRTPAAADAIKIMREHYPQLLIGAGTILTSQDVKTAKESGADFIVAPGCNPRTIEACKTENIPIIPGANNPTAIEMALELDISLLKFFPAEASGGVSMVKSLLAPYQEINFMPTGGITLNNIKSYLTINRVIACGGSWMVNETLLKQQDFTEIRRQVKGIVEYLEIKMG